MNRTNQKLIFLTFTTFFLSANLYYNNSKSQEFYSNQNPELWEKLKNEVIKDYDQNRANGELVNQALQFHFDDIGRYLQTNMVIKE